MPKQLDSPIQYVRRIKVKAFEKIKKATGLKPHLSYVEFHLADHCNLNCRGCGHFSPIAKKQFPDLNDYQRDLAQLKRLFSKIYTIVLMGGEPLLNPQIAAFLSTTRASFPKANILVYTNGILLPKMPKTFWKVCRESSVSIDITIYPPIEGKKSSIIQLVKKNGLRIIDHSVNSFHAFYNRNGDTDPDIAFKKCRSRWYTPMLRDGKIYVCPKPATIDPFNEKYDLRIPHDGFVDLYEPDLNGWDIKERLNQAASICRYCTLGWNTIPVFPWATSNLVLQDWDALAIKPRNQYLPEG